MQNCGRNSWNCIDNSTQNKSIRVYSDKRNQPRLPPSSQRRQRGKPKKVYPQKSTHFWRRRKGDRKEAPTTHSRCRTPPSLLLRDHRPPPPNRSFSHRWKTAVALACVLLVQHTVLTVLATEQGLVSVTGKACVLFPYETEGTL